MLELLSGKASVDQIAKRLGVLPSTVEGWREDAVAGMAEALRRGNGKSVREVELEREVKQLRDVLTETAIMKALLEQALKVERDRGYRVELPVDLSPTGAPARSTGSGT